MKYILAVTQDNRVTVLERATFEAHKKTLTYVNEFNSKGEAFRFAMENL